MLRSAEPDDLDALLAIESQCFQSDRISARSMRRLLGRPTAVTLVYEDKPAGGICGYAMLLLRSVSAIGRLYSYATAPAHHRRGIGAQLLAAVEDEAQRRGCSALRAEVRNDNQASLNALERAGYSIFGHIPDYYEDGTEALRLQKRILNPQIAR